MTTFALYIALASSHCPATTIEILDHTIWNKYDDVHLQRAAKRCGQIYKDSPCLKKFIKVHHGQYRAICSRIK